MPDTRGNVTPPRPARQRPSTLRMAVVLSAGFVVLISFEIQNPLFVRAGFVVTPRRIGLASRVVDTPLGLATASQCSLVFAHGSGVRFSDGHAAGHVLVVTMKKPPGNGWFFHGDPENTGVELFEAIQIVSSHCHQVESRSFGLLCSTSPGFSACSDVLKKATMTP